jgi:hypothetical protein
MQVQRELPLMGRVSLGAKNALLSSLLRASAHLPEGFLVRTVRGIAGTNDFPMGQKFLEKALVSMKRAIKRANPRCRRKLIENLVLGEMVRGQAERNWVTEQLGYEIPLLLVISPTMRCPLRCYGCYAAEYGQDSDLDFESFDRLIGEAKALGIYFFVLSGGEPFAYKRIEEIFRKHSDAWFQVYTSGVTLNQTCVDRLAELGFCQLTTDNIHDKSLLDILQTSRLLAAIRKRQPYSDNYLRPCMMLDNPQTLKEVIEEADPRETCRGGARRLVNDLYPQLQAYASRWGELADREWKERYQESYRETIATAHTLSASFARCHEACPTEMAARSDHPQTAPECDRLSATM